MKAHFYSVPCGCQGDPLCPLCYGSNRRVQMSYDWGSDRPSISRRGLRNVLLAAGVLLGSILFFAYRMGWL
jgi:hypothetical protein